jgi:hypothetical protein
VEDADGAVLPIAGGAGPARAPIVADNNLLIAAAEGNHAGALTEIRAGQTFITPNQFNEFLDVATSAQRTARRAFLDAQNIRVFGGPQAGVLASSSEFQDTFLQVAAQQGRDDAALAAFARVTGFEAVTMDRRLYNFLTQTAPQLGVPIRRIY